MQVSNIIVHSISKDKNQPAEEVSSNLKPLELDADHRVVNFLDSVDEVYSKKTGKAYGKLEAESNFSRLLSELTQNESIDFVEFSHLSMSDLTRRIASEPFATGGYIVFARYSKNVSSDYLIVVMIKSKEGFSFNDELELLNAHQLDLDKLHFAARIDINNWQSDSEQNHVSFVKGRASGSVTQYFRDFLGIIEFSESAVATRELVVAITNYFSHHLKCDDAEVEQKKKLVHDYCLSKNDAEEPIYLDELSRFLDEENPNDFLQYAQEKHEIPNEFSADKTALRKFIKYSGHDKEVSISFKAGILGKRVQYKQEGDILTISPVPNKLRNQLVSNNE